MLILTRTIGQQVELTFPGPTPIVVAITVNDVRGRRVVLAFAAPASVRIVRPEAKTLPLPEPVGKAG